MSIRNLNFGVRNIKRLNIVAAATLLAATALAFLPAVPSHAVAISAQASQRITLMPSTVVTVAGTVNVTSVANLGIYKEVQLFCNVTAAATEAGDTLDVYVDASPDNGTTWINACHFTQVLGNGGAKSFVATLSPSATVGTAVVATTADAASGVVRPSVLTDRLRVRYVTVDATTTGNMSFTVSVLAFGRS